MTQATRGPIVIDTDVYGADLVTNAPLAAVYEPTIVGRPAFLSFQTVAELRFGSLRRNWGAARMGKLDAKVRPDSAEVRVAVPPASPRPRASVWRICCSSTGSASVPSRGVRLRR